MNPTNQYFWAQPLQSALNGINASHLIGVLSGVGYALLMLSFLWAVYESFLRGGDVRGFALSLLKYGVTTLVIQHWSQVFQDTVNGFNSIAGVIIQNSVNYDFVASWTKQLHAYYAAQDSSGMTHTVEIFSHIREGLGAAFMNLFLTVVAMAIWPLCVEVFALVYSLWGCVLYCIGPLVLGLMPSMGFSRITKSYIQNVIIWNMWVVMIAILWAMLWAMNLTSLSTVLNSDGLLGYMQGVNATLLVSISTLLLSICTLLIPFVARHILHGEFGPAGMAAAYLSQRAARLMAGVFSGGTAAAASGGSAGMGGMISGGYGGGLPSGGSGGSPGGIFTSSGAYLPGGSGGSGGLSLPPPETPPPDGGTRYFPRGNGPLLLPPNTN